MSLGTSSILNYLLINKNDKNKYSLHKIKNKENLNYYNT